MLTKKGVWRFDSGVDAICRFTEPKNIKLFEDMKILSADECAARQTVLLNHYIGQVEMEALCLIDLINQHVIPSAKQAAVGSVAELEAAVKTIRSSLASIHGTSDDTAKAQLCRTLRLETMIEVRKTVDELEAIVPANMWTLATYKDLLFLDQTLE